MEYVRLGRTGLRVSVACLGTGGHSRLGTAYGSSFADAEAIVAAAVDNGVNFIDTAITYGTEEIVGAALKGKRSQVVISTKCGATRTADGFADDVLLSGKDFGKAVEGCLSRLRTDYIDILYVHGLLASQYEYCRDEILPVIDSLKRAGKIRYSAVSERFSSDPTHSMLEIALAEDRFDVVMVGLNLLNQTALRRVLPAANAQDVGVQVMYVVRSLADEVVVRDLVKAAVGRGEIDPSEVVLDDPFAFLIAPGVAESVPDACYRFARHSAGVDAVVTGTGKMTHLMHNLRSINGPPLPTKTMERLGRVFGRIESICGDR